MVACWTAGQQVARSILHWGHVSYQNSSHYSRSSSTLYNLSVESWPKPFIHSFIYSFIHFICTSHNLPVPILISPAHPRLEKTINNRRNQMLPGKTIVRNLLIFISFLLIIKACLTLLPCLWLVSGLSLGCLWVVSSSLFPSLEQVFSWIINQPTLFLMGTLHEDLNANTVHCKAQVVYM